MTSSRPYLVRAIYEWLVDNELTPYIVVDATYVGVEVPQKYIKDRKIILNIAPMAVRDFSITNHEIQFDARFSGINFEIYVPIDAVMAIYAFENGRGMVFNDDDHGNDTSAPSDLQVSRPRRKPTLRIVK